LYYNITPSFEGIKERVKKKKERKKEKEKEKEKELGTKPERLLE